MNAPISPVSVCFTSRSSAGAWQIRGQQISSARANWVAINNPTEDDIRRTDLVCIVKKPTRSTVEFARRFGKPIVFDIVDSWAQPGDGLRCRTLSDARNLFAAAWGELAADAYIFPTRQMQVDLGDLVPFGATIYHHFRPNISLNPVRDTVRLVGYEGADYLGEWRERIEAACADRGLRFVMNPDDYQQLDLVFFARGGAHGGFLSHRYKSNVKLANAMGSGTPALAHYSEISIHETDSGDVMFFTDAKGSLERQLDRLIRDHSRRLAIQRGFLQAASNFSLVRIANDFEAFFLHVLKGR